MFLFFFFSIYLYTIVDDKALGVTVAQFNRINGKKNEQICETSKQEGMEESRKKMKHKTIYKQIETYSDLFFSVAVAAEVMLSCISENFYEFIVYCSGAGLGQTTG